MGEHDQDFDSGLATERHTVTKKPRPWNVLLHNDDYTTMDFVQTVLITIFHHNASSAAQLMLQVHHKGKAVAGTYTRDIAETKQSEAMVVARKSGHPLKCTVEPASAPSENE